MLSFEPRQLDDGGVLKREMNRVVDINFTQRDLINLNTKVSKPSINIPDYRDGSFPIAPDKDRFGFNGIFNYTKGFNVPHLTERELYGKHHVSSKDIDKVSPYQLTKSSTEVKEAVNMMNKATGKITSTMDGYEAATATKSSDKDTWAVVKTKEALGQEMLDIEKANRLYDTDFMNAYDQYKLDRLRQIDAKSAEQLAEAMMDKVTVNTQFNKKASVTGMRRHAEGRFTPLDDDENDVRGVVAAGDGGHVNSDIASRSKSTQIHMFAKKQSTKGSQTSNITAETANAPPYRMGSTIPVGPAISPKQVISQAKAAVSSPPSPPPAAKSDSDDDTKPTGTKIKKTPQKTPQKTPVAGEGELILTAVNDAMALAGKYTSGSSLSSAEIARINALFKDMLPARFYSATQSGKSVLLAGPGCGNVDYVHKKLDSINAYVSLLASAGAGAGSGKKGKSTGGSK
jgi:DNA-binding transcriptional regulator YbjK